MNQAPFSQSCYCITEACNEYKMYNHFGLFMIQLFLQLTVLLAVWAGRVNWSRSASGPSMKRRAQLMKRHRLVKGRGTFLLMAQLHISDVFSPTVREHIMRVCVVTAACWRKKKRLVWYATFNLVSCLCWRIKSQFQLHYGDFSCL